MSLRAARRCPHPHKHGYRTKKRALQAAAQTFIAGSTPYHLRVYRCRCHRWHLTKRGALDAEIARLMKRAA